MHPKTLLGRVFLTILLMILSAILPATLLLTGCSSQGSAEASDQGSVPDQVSGQNTDQNPDKNPDKNPDQKRDTQHTILFPSASGSTVYENDTISIDASNTSEGYVMLQYSGEADKIRLQMTVPDGSVYDYTMSAGSYETFPLSGGDGKYHMDIYEHAYDNMYAIAFSQDIDVALNDEFKPFLYPNQYVWFTEDNKAVSYGVELSDQSSDDLDYVAHVYHYVIENISYDKELAANISVDYLPDIETTMETGKGICFDYASLMTALLRSQGIPTKLVVGYSGEAYHAWISVYLKETGWVDDIIQFDGKSWVLMDPTLAANNSASAVGEYIGDGSNYTVKYTY